MTDLKLLSDDEVMGGPPAGSTGGLRLLSDDEVTGGPPRAVRPLGAAMVQQQPRPQTENAPQTDVGPQGRSWGEAALEGATNIPSSAWEFAKAVTAPIHSPIQTGKALVGLADAVGSKISRPGNLTREQDPEPTKAELAERLIREAPADAVAEFFAERYGSMEGLKNTLATDPVGMGADFSTVLSGGSTLPIRGAQTIGRIGAAIDPLSQAGNAIRQGVRAGEAIASNVLGMTTGAGAESVRAAGRAGRIGEEVGEAFRDNMRGKVDVSDVVGRAKSALDEIRQERGAEYRSGMVDLSKDREILSFADIDTAINKAGDVGKFKGANIAPTATEMNDKLSKIVNDWKTLDPESPLFKNVHPDDLTPANFHTPEGLDALKRTIGDVRSSALPNTPERLAADRVYNAVKGEIVAQAPAYADIMKAYEGTSEKIGEISRGLSLTERATGDTAARKLLSATRNNVQTNYGGRQKMIDALAEHDPTLPYAIAGQGLNATLPRGLVARGGLAAGVTTGSMAANPLAIASLPAFSPRIVGEGVYLGGRLVGTVDDVLNAFGTTAQGVREGAQAAFQTGRAGEVVAEKMRDAPDRIAARVRDIPEGLASPARPAALGDNLAKAVIDDFRTAALSDNAADWLKVNREAASRVLTPQQIGGLEAITRSLSGQTEGGAKGSILEALIDQRGADTPSIDGLRRVLNVSQPDKPGASTKKVMETISAALLYPDVAAALMRRAAPGNIRLAERAIDRVVSGIASHNDALSQTEH